MTNRTLILGAGMTGLAAGIASGHTVIEAEGRPGGISLSYRMRAGDSVPLPGGEHDDASYRFENGGGHWTSGGDPAVLQFIRRLVPVAQYVRRSSAYFSNSGQIVPYPLQNHLRCLDSTVGVAALSSGGAV